MCGIFCAFNLSKKRQNILEVLNPKLCQLLENRGPDKSDKIILNDEQILFAGFLLWHQGEEFTKQPMQDHNGILLFNGDIFNMDSSVQISDTMWLLSKLNECKDDRDILEIFRTIEGPYCFIYYNTNTKMLYFGRDSLGRNSLIIENDRDIVKISSLSLISSESPKKTIEVPSIGIYKINMNNLQTFILYPWQNLRDEQLNTLKELENILQATSNISEPINPEWLISNEMKNNGYNFYDIVNEINKNGDVYGELLKNAVVSTTVNQLLHLLEESTRKRVQTTQKHCSSCLKQIINEQHYHSFNECKDAKIGILFSGGIDCTILAALSHIFVDPCEPIDLINIAFESVSSHNKNDKNIDWNVPDRLSAKESYEELRNLYPERVWNLVEVNVDRLELYEMMSNHICHLIYPLNTILDESIGATFWFASRGIGRVNGSYYESKCRVILVGLGADELFGGYTRHRNSFERCKSTLLNDKLQSLKDELEVDWNRLPSRNLGRDDRVIGDNGKTSRTPFIEENIIKFVRNLKPEQKCCLTLNQGIGDKLLLRLCGYQLGLKKCTTLKKKAIQFGSKIADKKQNATDISKFLKVE